MRMFTHSAFHKDTSETAWRFMLRGAQQLACLVWFRVSPVSQGFVCRSCVYQAYNPPQLWHGRLILSRVDAWEEIIDKTTQIIIGLWFSSWCDLGQVRQIMLMEGEAHKIAGNRRKSWGPTQA